MEKTRKRELKIITIWVIVDTAAVAIAKLAGHWIIAAFIAGFGVGAGVVYGCMTNRELRNLQKEVVVSFW